MAPCMQKFSSAVVLFLLLCFLVLSFYSANSQSFIGVNYGQVADNLPPPESTAKLLQSTSIERVRLYGADPAIIRSLADTGIGIVIGTANGDIPALAADPNFAGNWVKSNVLAYFPASKIIAVCVGNEVVMSPDQYLVAQLLPAMQNVQNALNAASLGEKIKVSTVHSMEVLSQSEPPSSGAFGNVDTMKALLQFHSANGSPFMINPYPFFAYQSDPRPDTLAFCLFQPNAGRLDAKTGIKYVNMFDAQVDAVYSALKAMGFKDVEIVVAETGWPYKGDPDEVGPSLDNAKAYNGNLIKHLRSMVGTPLMPGKSVDTYIFALYDENLKPGPTSERSFGLFKPDLSLAYDVGLSKSTQTPPSLANLAPKTTSTPTVPALITPVATPVKPAPITATPTTPAPTTPVANPMNPASATPTTSVNPATAPPTTAVNPVVPAPPTPMTPANPTPSTLTTPVNPATATLTAPVNPVAPTLRTPVNLGPATPTGPVNQAPVTPKPLVNPSPPTPRTPVNLAPATPTTLANPAPKTPTSLVNPAPPALANLTPETPTIPANPAPTTPSNPVPSHIAGWCVPKHGISDAQLQANLDYACGRGIDCSAIQPGGACFEPTTVASHAAYAMNLLYQSAGRDHWSCNFLQTATVTPTNPSYDSCIYPGGNT